MTAFPFVEEDTESINKAVKDMKRSQLKIFVLQAYDVDVDIMIDAMRKEGMIKENGDWSPYYFLGYDGFMDAATFAADEKMRTNLAGIVGTCQSSFNQFEGLPNLPEALSKAVVETKKLIQRHGKENIDTMLPYGYDEITTLLLATEKYIQKHGDYMDGSLGLKDHLESIGGAEAFTGRYLDIMKQISFDGITGKVSFDENGDRKDGLVAYCHYSNDEYKTIGFFLDGEENGFIDQEAIVWNSGKNPGAGAGTGPSPSSPDDPMVKYVLFTALMGIIIGSVMYCVR